MTHYWGKQFPLLEFLVTVCAGGPAHVFAELLCPAASSCICSLLRLPLRMATSLLYNASEERFTLTRVRGGRHKITLALSAGGFRRSV
jgi:hypothetical protein